MLLVSTGSVLDVCAREQLGGTCSLYSREREAGGLVEGHALLRRHLVVALEQQQRVLAVLHLCQPTNDKPLQVSTFVSSCGCKRCGAEPLHSSVLRPELTCASPSSPSLTVDSVAMPLASSQLRRMG